MQEIPSKICPVTVLTLEDPLSDVRRTTLTGLLLSLYLAVGSLPTVWPFTAFLPILAGLMLGPTRGAMVGAMGDILHYALHPRGPYLPFFTLTGALTGALPAFFLRNRPRTFIYLLVAIGLSQALTKLMVVYLRSHFFGHPWWITLPSSFIEQTLHVPIYAFACSLILRHWHNYLRHTH